MEREAITFNHKQKEILLRSLVDYTNWKESGRSDTKSVCRQAIAALRKSDIHFLTPHWSRSLWIGLTCSPYSRALFFENTIAFSNFQFLMECGQKIEEPRLNKDFKNYKDLEDRLRKAWDDNKTYNIVFKD